MKYAGSLLIGHQLTAFGKVLYQGGRTPLVVYHLDLLALLEVVLYPGDDITPLHIDGGTVNEHGSYNGPGQLAVPDHAFCRYFAGAVITEGVGGIVFAVRTFQSVKNEVSREEEEEGIILFSCLYEVTCSGYVGIPAGVFVALTFVYLCHGG